MFVNGKRIVFTSISNGICVSMFIFGYLPVDVNINIETHIPLELFSHPITVYQLEFRAQTLSMSLCFSMLCNAAVYNL